MNLARRILEGIHEVELQVTPEFQKEWPAPKVWSRNPAGHDSSGYTRYRTVFMWPNKAVVEGLEVFKPADHEFNVWAPKSKVESGSWASAMGSIKATGRYPGGIFVYVESEEDPAFREIDAIVTGTDTVDAYAIIKNYSPGEEPVVDHFLGYEGEPASVQQALAKVGQGVRLSGATKLAIANRPWMHVVKMNDDVSELNPVMILVDNIPIEASVDEKKIVVQGKFNRLRFQIFWAEKIGAWKVWPLTGQSADEFEEQLDYLMNGIDATIDAAEET